MNDSIIEMLQTVFGLWNQYMMDIWNMVSMSPVDFRDGAIWPIILDVYGVMQATGLALLVLFFVIGVVRTCGSFADVKRPEQVFKIFIRFAIAKGMVTYGLELILLIFQIVQGIILSITGMEGFETAATTVIPEEIVTAIAECGFFESIGLWALTMIGSLVVIVLAFIMVMTVFGRFFKIYLYTALSPLALSTFAGESTQSTGISFLKSYAGVCLEGAVIALSCLIFSVYASALVGFEGEISALAMVLSYMLAIILNMLMLVGTVKASDRVVREMIG